MKIPELSLEYFILIVVIAILVILLLKYKYTEYTKRRKQRKQFSRGVKLENEAKSYLEKKGYKVIYEQHEYIHQYEVNGVIHKSVLRPDYIVSRKGKMYIVEVKSGKSAISIANSGTRRQILEYDYVIENDGIFLLDMENKELQLVKFSTKKEKKEKSMNLVIYGIALLAIIVPYWYVKLIIVLILLLYLLKYKKL
jgi:Holliday junction resolvase